MFYALYFYFLYQQFQQIFHFILGSSLILRLGKFLPLRQNFFVVQITDGIFQVKPSFKIHFLSGLQNFFDKEIGESQNLAVGFLRLSRIFYRRQFTARLVIFPGEKNITR